MALHLAVLVADDAMRRGEIDDLRALVLGGLDLLGDGRHVLALAAVDDRHVRAQPAGRAGGVDGGVAAADDDDALADRDLLAARHALEERQGRDHARELGAGQVDPGLFPGADGHEDGVVLVGHVVERGRLADVDVELELDAQPLDQLDLLVEHGLGQPVLRQRVAQHAAGGGRES